jgi:thiol-disulfide isomerase/thioredoxin
MKNLGIVVLAALMHFASIAAPKNTIVTFKFHNPNGSAISLYKIENGEAVTLGFRRPGINDTCSFSVPVEGEGIYFFSKPGGHSGSFHYVIYLKAGENKCVELYNNRLKVDFDSCKVVAPNHETQYLQAWTNVLNDYCKLGIDRIKRDEFIAAYSNFVKQANELKAKAVTSNRFFNQLFASKVNTDILYAKAGAFFYFGERMNGGIDTSSMHTGFYESLANEKFTGSILNSENGMQLLRFNIGHNLFLRLGAVDKMLKTPFKEKASSIMNYTLRRVYVVDHIKDVTNYATFQAEIDPFKSVLTTKQGLTAYEKKKDELLTFAKGAQAYNFSLYDTKDKLVSLSDFKGKVVVLDIWAMWCASCLQEKPYFQKLEEEYKNRNDIVFIGVSHDGISRKDVWKKFVAAKGWENTELLANFNESIGEYYKIEGIPRFMVFDKEGKIVTVDAPRPSNPELKKLIDQTLKTTDATVNR